MRKAGQPDAIVKFVSETSKNMLPSASTFMRAVVVGVFGTSTDSLPSLSVLATRTIGKVMPPSVDSDIFTFAALIGAADVPATLHVTVWWVPVVQVCAVLGIVTTKSTHQNSTDRKSTPL